MLLRSLAFVCALAAGTAAWSDEVQRLNIGDLSPGSRFEIATADRLYRGELIDPATGEARMIASRDGQRFSEPRTVYLLGATQGRAPEAGGLMLVKMNQIQTGLRVELGVGTLAQRDRFLTEPVRMIRVD